MKTLKSCIIDYNFCYFPAHFLTWFLVISWPIFWPFSSPKVICFWLIFGPKVTTFWTSFWPEYWPDLWLISDLFWNQFVAQLVVHVVMISKPEDHESWSQKELMCGPISGLLADSRHPELRPNQCPGTYSCSQKGAGNDLASVVWTSQRSMQQDSCFRMRAIQEKSPARWSIRPTACEEIFDLTCSKAWRHVGTGRMILLLVQDKTLCCCKTRHLGAGKPMETHVQDLHQSVGWCQRIHEPVTRQIDAERWRS